METSLKIHNLIEDMVVEKIDEICREIDESGQKQHICTCHQCRLDTACYVLNRTRPCYVSGSRGVARVEQETMKRQQEKADLDVLIYKALEQVAHNRRPFFSHSGRDREQKNEEASAVFNIPVIVGRVFNGVNFEPLAGAEVELRRGGKLVPMRDFNWQNPCPLIDGSDGTFTFWSAPVDADNLDERSVFEFSVRVNAKGFEALNIFFELNAVSEKFSEVPFSMDRTFKLKDMFVFPVDSSETGE